MTTKRSQLEALAASALDRRGEAPDTDEPPSVATVAPVRPKPEEQAKAAPAKPVPTPATPKKAPTPRAKSKSRQPTPKPSPQTGELPPPVRRLPLAEGEELKTIQVDLPAELDDYRKAAQKVGMNKTHLVLSVIEAHGDAIRDEVDEGRALLPFTTDGHRVRWSLQLSEAEHKTVVELIETVGPAMPRKKNAAVISLIMARAAGLTS